MSRFVGLILGYLRPDFFNAREISNINKGNDHENQTTAGKNSTKPSAAIKGILNSIACAKKARVTI